MEGLDRYITELLEKGLKPEAVLSKDIREELLEKYDKKMKGLLPEEFKELYKTYNGETQCVGFVGGFELLSIERVMTEADFFKTYGYDYDPVGTEVISEKPMSKNKWVPFAFDGSECFLIVDLSPAKKGKTGQIIGIDMTNNVSYLMADSLNEFFGNMAGWVKDGKLVVDMKSRSYIVSEKSGHLFNNINDYAKINESCPRVMVPVKDDFWISRYREKIKKEDNGDCYVSSTVLAKESVTFRIMYDPVNISCEPFQYMDKIKELVIHNSTLRDFEGLCKMPNLTTLYIINCRIIDSDLSKLACLPKLKKLSIGKMGDADSIQKLSSMKSLRELTVANIDNFDAAVLGKFTGLTSLEMEIAMDGDGGFLSKLSKLKTLKISNSKLYDLDFILSMPKLEEFEMTTSVENEDALLKLSELGKLKVFKYPVKDLNVYKMHPSIEIVGLDGVNNKKYQVFAGSKVDGFFLYATSKETMDKEIEETAAAMEKYVNIRSYGGSVFN